MRESISSVERISALASAASASNADSFSFLEVDDDNLVTGKSEHDRNPAAHSAGAEASDDRLHRKPSAR